MKRVLLIHCRSIPHYRIPIYSFLSKYLPKYGFDLTVISDDIQADNPHSIDFKHVAMPLSSLSIARFARGHSIDVIILFVDMRHAYLFPTYFIARGLFGRKMIYWGQGCDLLDRRSRIKNFAFIAEQALCNSLILYAEHLKKYIPTRFHGKTFVANNTIAIDYQGLPAGARERILAKHGVVTKKNIICIGRIQKRKRLDHLIEAHSRMNRADVGVIIAGPDPDGILRDVDAKNIYKLGPIYGDNKYDLLSAADIYCLPGAVGLSIVDAFYCGLPLVTEEGDESAELMYLRNGVNGFMVPEDDIDELGRKLTLLLDDNLMRKRFSENAKREFEENASLEKFGSGFRDALLFVTTKRDLPEKASESYI
jgi:glycosyltransferase involved in cell wall biosynthesis